MVEAFELKEDNLEELAGGVLECVLSLDRNKATVILLEGDLGAGKTTFTKAFAEKLGITEMVKSPTFILKKEYASPHAQIKKLVHVDAYRFNDHREARVLRLDEELDNKETVVMIEWPSKMNYVKGDINISFDVIDDNTRKVAISYEDKQS